MNNSTHKKSKYWKNIGIASILLTMILIARIIYIQYSIGFPKKNLIIECLISVVPILLYVVMYSFSTKQTFAKGFKLKKKEAPVLYYIMTIFWTILLILDIMIVFMIKSNIMII